MLDVPMSLVTDEWKAIARGKIVEIKIGHGKTSGIFEVLKVYSDKEIEAVSGTFILPKKD